MALSAVGATTAAIIPNSGNLVALFEAGAESVAIGKAFFARIASFYIIFGLATAVRSCLEGSGDLAYSSLAGIAPLKNDFLIDDVYFFISSAPAFHAWPIFLSTA